MQLKFLGTGGAFEPAYGNSAAILELNGQNILLDAGFTVYPRLVELGLWHLRRYILLTHLHNDHCGSLANILLHHLFFGNGEKVTILYPDEAFRQQITTFLEIQLKNITPYADFKPLSDLPGISMLNTYNRHSENFQTYSYIFEEAQERIVYSGDLRDSHFLFAHVATLPILPTTVYHDISFNPENKGHALYTDLMLYQDRYPIFGYHCDPTQNPPDNTIPLVYNQPYLLYT
jgi:ribonuclease BN (tRNA processing enzyme)